MAGRCTVAKREQEFAGRLCSDRILYCRIPFCSEFQKALSIVIPYICRTAVTDNTLDVFLIEELALILTDSRISRRLCRRLQRIVTDIRRSAAFLSAAFHREIHRSVVSDCNRAGTVCIAHGNLALCLIISPVLPADCRLLFTAVNFEDIRAQTLLYLLVKVVDIQIDVIRILADHAGSVGLPLGIQTLAGIVLQVEDRSCHLPRLARVVAHPGVLVPPRIAGSVMLGCEFTVHLVLFCLDRPPAGRKLTLLQNVFKTLRRLVRQTRECGNCRISARALERVIVLVQISVAGHAVESLEKVALCTVFRVVVSASDILNDKVLCAVDNFLSGRNMNGSVNHLAEEIQRDIPELVIHRPISRMITLGVVIAPGLLEIIRPHELRSVDDGCAVEGEALHTDRKLRHLTVLILRLESAAVRIAVAPSGLVIANAVVAAVSGQITAERLALGIRNVSSLRIFFLENVVLRITLAGLFPLRTLLHHRNRIQPRTPVIRAEVDVEITAVFVAELQKSRKVLISLHRRHREVLGLEAPELLAVIESDKRRIVAEKFTKQRVLKIIIRRIIREMTLASAGRLNHRPHALVRAGAEPGFRQTVSVLDHFPLMCVHIIVDRHRDIEHAVRPDILRNQPDNFGRIRVIPGVNVNDQHRFFRRTGPSQRTSVGRLCRQRRSGERRQKSVLHSAASRPAPVYPRRSISDAAAQDKSNCQEHCRQQRPDPFPKYLHTHYLLFLV